MVSPVLSVLPSAIALQTLPIDRSETTDDNSFIKGCLARVSLDHFLKLDKYLSDIVGVNPLLKYTPEERSFFYQDLEDALQGTFEKASKGKGFLMTAGGPAAGKSTLLESLMDPSYAYVDPDRAGLLKYMKRTYSASTLSPTDAYNYWREASICIGDLMLAIGLSEGYNIAYGTTMTTPFAKPVLSNISTVYGRSIAMLHVTSPNDIRMATEAKRRENGIVQCTDQDLINKGNDLYHRLDDFLRTAAQISFYYRDAVDGVPVLAATWEKRKMTVLNSSAVEEIIKQHDQRKGDGYFSAVLGTYTQ